MIDKFINIEDLLYTFKKKFWIIIIVTLFTTTVGIYKASKLKPTYVANATVFIGKGSELVEYYSKEEVDYYSQLVSIFNELSKVDGFFDNILRKNRINKTSTEVAYGISFSSSSNTPMVRISYSSGSDDKIEDILNAVSDELVNKIKQIAPESQPTIISKAKSSTIYANKKKIQLTGFVAGVIISAMIILVIDFLDDRVNSKRRLAEVLPVPVIGNIPTHEKEFRKENNDVHNKQNAKVNISRGV